MYLHSCQSTKRNKSYPWHIFRKSVCALQYLKGTELEVSPPIKAEREIFRFFFSSATSRSLVCYFSCGVHCSFHTLQFSPSSLCTFHSISAHFLVLIFSSFTFQLSFSFPTDSLSSFRILLSIWVSFLFTTTESFLHCPCPHQDLYLVSLAQEPWEIQASPKGKRWQCFGDSSADRAWVCHSRHELTVLGLASHFHSRPLSLYTGRPPAKLKTASFRVV